MLCLLGYLCNNLSLDDNIFIHALDYFYFEMHF